MDWIAPMTVILLLLSIGVNQASALKCYACGDSNTFLGLQNGNPHSSCDDLEKSEGEALKRFIIDCPEGYVGCITQKQGDHLMRACDTLAFDDCQSANGITYCYCRENLCNKPGAMVKAVTSTAHIYLSKASELTDDEDYVEMSGNGDIDDVATDNGPIIKNDSVKSATSTSRTQLETVNSTWATVTTTALIENITNELSTTGTTVPNLKNVKNINRASVMSVDSHGSCTLCNSNLLALTIIALLQLLLFY